MESAPRSAEPAHWIVDADQSSIDFAVKTCWGLATVQGDFERFDGSYEIGPDGPKIKLTIEADSLDTGNGKRDEIEAITTIDPRQLGMSSGPLGMIRPPATVHVDAHPDDGRRGRRACACRFRQERCGSVVVAWRQLIVSEDEGELVVAWPRAFLLVYPSEYAGTN
jgi:hypothetical protein